MGDERWDDIYGFLNPTARAKCSKEQFFAASPAGITSVKSFFGIQHHERLEYRIAKVYIEGSKWVVEPQIFFNGEPLAWEDSGGVDSVGEIEVLRRLFPSHL